MAIYRGSGGSVVADTLNIDGDYGDITVANSGQDWTINPEAVTLAKIQTIATDTLLGRATAGTGVVEQITLTQAGRDLLDDANASAQRTTLGLGTAAVTDSTAYATAAQGALADTAIQPADITDVVRDADIVNMLETTDIGVTVQGYDANTAKLNGVTQNFTGTLQNGGSNVVVDSDIGVTVQAYAAQLADIAGLTPTDNTFIVGNGTNFVSEDASTARSSLGLGTLATQSGTFSGTSSGTNTGDQSVFQTIAVAGQSNVVADTTTDTLTLVAGTGITLTTDAATDSITINAAVGGLPDGDKGDITVSVGGTVWTIDSGVVTTTKLGGDITTAGKELLDDATAGDQRTTLGLGTIATQSAASVAITGGSITGITNLAIADGGTGASSAAAAFANLKQAASNTATGVVELATNAEVVTGTDTTRVVTPASMKAGLNATGTAPIYACRAWVNFNGTGTVSIRASGNVSSITDNGTGDYTVNFATPMPDANYSVSGSAVRQSGNSDLGFTLPLGGVYSTAAVRVIAKVFTVAGALDDATTFNVQVFR